MPLLNEFPRSISLRDDSLATIRFIRSDDKQRLLEGFNRLGERSIYYRFMGPKQQLTDKELDDITTVDCDQHVAIAVTIHNDGEEEIIGVGRYIKLVNDSSEPAAEISFTVADRFQGLGIGTILFEHLVTIAQDNGIVMLIADMLIENMDMLEIFKHSDLDFSHDINNGIAHIEMNIKAQEFTTYYI